MENLEILAPAGDLKSFYSAINSGANAVYLGLSTFNARAKAENFSYENMREVVKFAHFHSAKVYLTINILFRDDEFDKLYQLIKFAIECKIDGYIVQDLGTVKFLKDNFSGIVLHASTQLGIHNLYGAKVAEKLGFSRVVLSRETRLEDIIEIKQNTKLEIEFFVQGALCSCFSGNCYMSSLLSNESGNRGRCLQYCRMNYSAYENEEEINNGYLLSAKDLSLIDELQKLIDAGVCSFKIEGRLRRSGYVSKTVEIYRKALDNIVLKQQNKVNTKELEKVFVRGTYNKKAYLYSANDDIIEKHYNNHSGIKIGKVINICSFKDLYKIEVLTNYKLSIGDGLKFYNQKKEVASLGIGNFEILKNGNYILYSKAKVQKDNEVHLILDAKMEKESESKVKLLSIDMSLFAYSNSNLKVVAKYKNIEVMYDSNYTCEKAKNQPTPYDEIITQISKTKDFGFILNNIDINKDDVFLPKSILNSARRNALELLKEKIIFENEKNIICGIKQNKKEKINVIKNKLKNNILIVKNIENLENYLKNNKNIYNICLKPEIYSENFILNFAKELKKFKYENFMLYLPVFADKKDLKNLDNIINKLENVILLANNIYGLYYLDRFEVIAGTGLNIYNILAVDELNLLGVSDYISSIENFIGGYKYCYGYFPLMTFLHCPFKEAYYCDCNTCAYNTNLSYFNQGRKFKINRIKNVNCQFELLASEITNVSSDKQVIDITI